MTDDRGFTTRATHGAEEVVRQRPVSLPIYQTATFAFDDMDEFAAIGQTKIAGGYLYSRWANPTVQALASTIASLEGAEATACFASGMAAIHTTLTTLVAAGEHIVSARQLYGGTHSLFGTVLSRAGISATTVDVTDHRAVAEAFTAQTRVLYAETIGNPSLPVADLEALASIAHEHGAAFVVDATFTPPNMLRPLAYGADLVVHAATKYLAGHSDVTAGVVSGSAERITAIRHQQIDTGGILAPFEAWLCARGVQTLALRMDRVSDSAMAIAQALQSHAAVERVVYPGLPEHPQHDLAKRLLGDRFGGMLSFDIAGGAAAGARFLQRVRVAAAAASLGGTKTLVVHPATITHTQLTPEQRAALGIGEGTIRLAVGIEDVEDLIADLTQALT